MRKILFIFAAVLLSSIGLHADVIITYTATARLSGSGGRFEYGSARAFFLMIKSHTFSNGVGTITCIDGTVTVGEYAFFDNQDLISIEFPTNTKKISRGAFEASNLTSITLPNMLKTIDQDAFSECEKLKTIYCYAPTPPTLGNDVFKKVKQNELSVWVLDLDAYKEQWNQLSPTCFKPLPGCEITINDIRYEVLDGNKARVVAKDGGYSGNIAIPEQVTYQDMTFTVTEIGQSAFKNCAGLTAVTIPNTVTTIGMDAFWQCSNLTSVTIPNSLTTIGQSAFFETGLTAITIPASVKEIGAWAFKNCTSLSNLQFADREITDAINIGIYVFENLALEEVIIPDWMTDIPEGLFFNNTKLKAIYLHEGVNSIDKHPFGLCPFEYIISMSSTPPALADGAFEGHDKDASVIVYVPNSDAVAAYQNSKWSDYFTNIITDINYRITSTTSMTAELTSVLSEEKMVSIPSAVAIDGTFYQVTGIGESAFRDNTLLESISLPPTIQYIGDNAFSGCTKLKQINSRAWEDLQTIGASAFYGCSALDSIVIPEGVQTIGKSAFMGCSNLTSISLPTGLKNIPDECFNQCPLGQEIIVPEGVETIGQTAFNGTLETRLRTESITLPSTLKEINLGAFYYRDGLKTITCRALIPPTLTGQAFAEYQYQKYKEEHITVYVPNRDVISAYKNSKWGTPDIYQFKFSDLMAEENKQYLYTVAGDNEEAKAIANAYCDSIDDANTAQEVQDYTNIALGKIDKLTLKDYKQTLIDSLFTHAGTHIEARQIAEQYKPQIENAYFRQDAERLFIEADKKIAAIFELIELKKDYISRLYEQTGEDPDLLKVAEDYSNLIQLAETLEEVRAIYDKAERRITINKRVKDDWTDPASESIDKCSTTKGYIY